MHHLACLGLSACLQLGLFCTMLSLPVGGRAGRPMGRALGIMEVLRWMLSFTFCG